MKSEEMAGGCVTRTLFACFVVLLFLSLPLKIHAGPVWQTVVDGSSFSDTNAFLSQWHYNYPWGTDQNRSARMNATNLTVSHGMVTLTSSPVTGSEGESHASPHLPIRYHSGTFFLKHKITINKQYPVWDVSGQFKVPAQIGAWPAFWMTGADSWPPESDFMEFKGSDGCNQNTYNGHWLTHITPVPTAGSDWHTYRVVARLIDSTNVNFYYFIDKTMESKQTSTTFVDSPCWLIVDFQMEGSSGKPGPSYITYSYVTNIVVKRLVAGDGGNSAGTNGVSLIP